MLWDMNFWTLQTGEYYLKTVPIRSPEKISNHSLNSKKYSSAFM